MVRAQSHGNWVLRHLLASVAIVLLCVNSFPQIWGGRPNPLPRRWTMAILKSSCPTQPSITGVAGMVSDLNLKPRCSVDLWHPNPSTGFAKVIPGRIGSVDHERMPNGCIRVARIGPPDIGYDRLRIAGNLSAAADGGNDRNLRPGGNGTRESTRISDVFVSDKNIDVFPHLSLFRCDTVSNARVECP
jgi:hypothetical protein